ncbi:MAG: YeeE/YedE family protein [Myxococcales bacterium]|nr:YeeE/YedE family protein [Myxococcales bacterium]
MRHAFAFLVGLIFAVGLGLAGMTQPAKVIGFLDFTGRWDPSLAFVMLGAIAVHFILFRLVLKRKSPLFAGAFQVPGSLHLDHRLIMGSAIFGIGWGLAGYCPGPAIVSSGGGSGRAILFTAAMLIGMLLFRAFMAWDARRGDERVTQLSR